MKPIIEPSKVPTLPMSDNEFIKLQKAEQEVLAQIAQQKATCDNLRAEFQSIRDSFLGSYNAVFQPLSTGLARLAGGDWDNRRGSLNGAVSRCSAGTQDFVTSDSIGRLQNSLKVQVKEAWTESESSVSLFREMSASLSKLEALILGRDSKDVLDELQTKKQRLEKEEERLKSLQDQYDRYFGDRRPKATSG